MYFDVAHATCSKQPSYYTIQARISRYHTCNSCLHTQLPFFNVSNLDSSYDMCNAANDKRLSTQNANSINLFLFLILTRKVSVQHLTNSHVC